MASDFWSRCTHWPKQQDWPFTANMDGWVYFKPPAQMWGRAGRQAGEWVIKAHPESILRDMRSLSGGDTPNPDTSG